MATVRRGPTTVDIGPAAGDQAKAEARAGGMKVRTLGWIKLVAGQTYENAFRERLSWDVLLVVRPAP